MLRRQTWHSERTVPLRQDGLILEFTERNRAAQSIRPSHGGNRVSALDEICGA
jgi:hypothetical protein